MDAAERISIARAVALVLRMYGPRKRTYVVKLLGKLTTEDAIAVIVEGLDRGILVEKDGKLAGGTTR